MNVFEYQVIPVGIHNLSKKNKTKFSYDASLMFGHKFDSEWGKNSTRIMFRRLNECKNIMSLKVCITETKPGVFEENNLFKLKGYFVPPKEYSLANNFCWNRRDDINALFENGLTEKQNMSNREKHARNVLINNRNVKICVNKTDKKLGLLSADKVKS